MNGNPMNQIAAATSPQPAPNPNPQAPPVQRPSLPGTVTPSTPAELRGAQVSPSPQGGPPGAAPPPPNPQAGLPPSAATQSPPDLAQLYMKMMQQQYAGSQVNQGLAKIASAWAAPGTQGQIMHSMDNAGGQNPGDAINTLMQLQSMQRLQGMPAPTGVDPAIWNAASPDMRAKIAGQAAESGIAIQQKQQEEKQTGLYEAQTSLPDLTAKMSDMDNRINIIKNTPEGDSTALQNILSNDSKKRELYRGC